MHLHNNNNSNNNNSKWIKVESDNQTLSLAKQQSPSFNEDISFDIDNVTFSHHMASVNGIQIHYVIGGKWRSMLFCCMVGQKHGMHGDI